MGVLCVCMQMITALSPYKVSFEFGSTWVMDWGNNVNTEGWILTIDRLNLNPKPSKKHCKLFFFFFVLCFT